MTHLQQLALFAMEFPERLAALRKERGLTQQALADKVGVHVLQIRRYEGGNSQPTLEVVKRLAVALSVSADVLVFDSAERDPAEDLRLQFEAVSQFDEEEKNVVRALIDGMIIKHQAKRLLRPAPVKTAAKARPPRLSRERVA